MFEFQFQRATASTLSFVSVLSLGSILSPIMPGNVQPSRFKSILNWWLMAKDLEQML